MIGLLSQAFCFSLYIAKYEEGKLILICYNLLIDRAALSLVSSSYRFSGWTSLVSDFTVFSCVILKEIKLVLVIERVAY